MKELSDKTIEFLKGLASKRSGLDDSGFSIYDSSGGNYDDAYGMGLDDGETALARRILKDLGIEFAIEDE